MSLIHKIPPLVSAVAFGYGVGMAAPESTITPVRAAAVAVQRSSDPGAAPPPVMWKPEVPARRVAIGQSPGEESSKLARLRESGAQSKRGESCELNRPLFSKSPRYESTRDREGVDVDDLDSAGTEALSKLQLPDLKLAITRRTLKFVRFFTRTDKGRGMFETWLKRSGKYQEMVTTELRERRLPEDLIWLAMIESGFDPRVKSPAGAVGLWQFMPATGAVYGLQQNRHLDQRKNPKLATGAAAHHLRDLYARFGNWDLALAAYNMGYEQLLDAIDRYGTADFNELARQQAIPEETSNYVPKIAAAAIVANNLERFGFEKVDVARPVDAAEIAVPPGTPLKILAKAAGVSTSAVRALNPDVLGERVPPGRGDYLLMIPADTLSRAHAALPLMLQNEPLLLDDASVLDPVSLMTGRELTKRRAKSDDDSLLSLLPAYRKKRSMRGPLAEADEDDGDDMPRRAPRRTSRETVVYRVGAGDTLSGIARQFAVDAEDVSRQNHLDGDEKLKVGRLLKLRVRKDQVDGAVRGDASEPARDKPERSEKKHGHKDS